jgi:8-oxo-dGTP diphosphatase
VSEAAAAAVARLHVVAGILRDSQGRVLIAQRPAGKPLAGRWEFPGGKVHEGESALAALARELTEELGVTLHAARQLMRYDVTYPERVISLDVWVVSGWSGEPQGLDGQALEWVPPAELSRHDILEADAPIVNSLSSLSRS